MWRFMPYPYFLNSLPLLTFSNSQIYFLIYHSLLRLVSVAPQTYAFAFATAADGITLTVLTG